MAFFLWVVGSICEAIVICVILFFMWAGCSFLLADKYQVDEDFARFITAFLMALLAAIILLPLSHAIS